MDFSSGTIIVVYSLQVSIVDEQIEDDLFHMLDEETDSEYVKEKNHLRYLGSFSCNQHPKWSWKRDIFFALGELYHKLLVILQFYFYI